MGVYGLDQPPLFLCSGNWVEETGIDWLDALRGRHRDALGAWIAAQGAVGELRQRFDREDADLAAAAEAAGAGGPLAAPSMTDPVVRQAQLAVARRAELAAVERLCDTVDDIAGRVAAGIDDLWDLRASGRRSAPTAEEKRREGLGGRLASRFNAPDNIRAEVEFVRDAARSEMARSVVAA
jgi:hypothetical protein